MKKSEAIKWTYIVGFLDFFVVSMIIPLLVTEVNAIGFSHFMNGVLGSVYGALQLFASPAVGGWSDRKGRKPVLLVCLFCTALSYGMLGTAPMISTSYPTTAYILMFVSRAIGGIFKHSQTLGRALLADVTTSSEKAAVFGRFNAFSSFGFIVGPLIGGYIGELQHGFSYLCFIGSIGFLVNMTITWTFLPDFQPTVNPSKTKSTLRDKNHFLIWKTCWDNLLLQFLLSLPSLIFRSNFSLILKEKFLLTPKGLGYITSFQGVVSSGSGLLTGKVERFYGNSLKLTRHGSIVVTASLLGMALAPDINFLIPALVVFCFSNAVLRVSCAKLLVDWGPEGCAGSLVGAAQSVVSVARMLGPLLGGIAREASPYGPGMSGFGVSLAAVVMVEAMSTWRKLKVE